ncbi:MAG: phospho-N-acetylmuramoyl-pentapeptide-transferase [Gemmatimonadota bacterium]|nr:phospho-N-acetylmuramoyl-pentapeptide-transferase [Gemmatimonadota bacterium]MDH5805600.1 phospho-N-acetylmuramoyl-pentapeptide-transferase [Gemmatimonadota bacterium]
MFYHFLTPLSDWFGVFNVFIYITFRAAGAAATAILMAFLVGPPVIKWLKRFNVGQVVRADGPASHQEKRGTPTMGGVIIIAATIIPTLLWARLDNRYVLVAIFATLWAGGIGFVDDYLKIVQQKSRGLVARYKLIGQMSFGIGLGIYLLLFPLATNLEATATTVPFFKWYLLSIPPVLYVLFVSLVVTGTSNAVNLTDGLDGLAAGLSVIAAGAFAIFAYVIGRSDASEYLQIFYLVNSGELTIFCASLTGASLGFLWFNSHPAEVFMGDTGSLALGGAFGTVAILLKSEFLLLIVGAVFAAEAVSVILQTAVFKYRRKKFGVEHARAHRLFRMAPLHHHYEKAGLAETKIVTRFYIIGILCALVALATLKIR